MMPEVWGKHNITESPSVIPVFTILRYTLLVFPHLTVS
jgi:hypothetical protein